MTMRTYDRSEVQSETEKYFKGDVLAADVCISKYYLRDADNNLYEKSPADLQDRLAREFARIEQKYPNPLSFNELKELFTGVDDNGDPCFGDVLAQGSPMSGIGNPFQVQSLSNCFVIDSPEDSYGGIMQADQQQVQIMKRRGGVGFDLSTIRPRGMSMTNAARTTDGVGVFMERFSNSCREVAQGGRRGALMLSYSSAGQDVETFINIKRDKKKVTGANVSVRVTDEFMQAVIDNKDYCLRYPVDALPGDAKTTKWVNAKEVWDQLIDSVWFSAEPGILFWDTIIKNTPASPYKKYRAISTNPCAEICLSKNDVCRLMVINIARFIENKFAKNAIFNKTRFVEVVKKAMRLMDDLVDLEIEAIDKIIEKVNSDPETEEVKRTELNLWQNVRDVALGGRRTGLGLTGVGDAIAMLNETYGSEKSIEIVEDFYKTLALASYRATVDMAGERGTFVDYDYETEKDNVFIRRIMEQDSKLESDYKRWGRRNVALLTTAPVGSTSMLSQTTSGIEPAYALSYKRRRKINPNDLKTTPDYVDDLGDKWKMYDVYHPGVQTWMNVTGETDIKKSPYWGATALDIDWSGGVRIQSAAQKWICHAISRTSNLPKNASHELISQIYIEAWKSGCKGFTAYRDGSRQGVLLSDSSFDDWFKDVPTEELQKLVAIAEKHSSVMPSDYLEFVNEKVKSEITNRSTGVHRNVKIVNSYKKRPEVLPCDLHRIKVTSNNQTEQYLVIVGLDGEKPYEVFCGLSKYIDIPKKALKGKVIKRKEKGSNFSTYDLFVPYGNDDDDGFTLKDIVTQFHNPNYGAFTRTMSLVLRHGIPIQFLVEQITKDKTVDFTTFSKAISRVLKEYISDGTPVTGGAKCPECGSLLIYHGGCAQCPSCPWSKC